MVVTLIFLAVLIGGMVIGMPIAHSLVLTGVDNASAITGYRLMAFYP